MVAAGPVLPKVWHGSSLVYGGYVGWPEQLGCRWPSRRHVEAGAAALDGGVAPLHLVLHQRGLEDASCVDGGGSGSRPDLV
jgi:hypothetical protein